MLPHNDFFDKGHGYGMRNSMNVNLYKIIKLPGTPDLEVLLGHIIGLNLEDRIKRIGNSDIRLDQIAPPGTPGNTSSFWMLDFIKMRFDHGPGKVGRTTAIEGFDLEDDQGFGEETAALFDPATGYLCVQYNHHGVRASAMQDYFNQMLVNPDNVTAYELRVKLDSSADVKLAQKQFITKISYKIAPTDLSPALRNANVGLASALSMNEQQGGNTLEMTISAARGENLLTKAARPLIEALRNIRSSDVQNQTHALTHFEVSGRVDEFSRMDAIDMLSPKLQVTIGELSLGSDRRYTMNSRWIGLQRAIRGWNAVLT
ncbi:hypothetical protein GJ700_17685 [Duganella sp. FT92W]|uniref:Uncharacterized protein n=1 Tax=Pseudoduganella rivuli TaxID=2666085 RepID=A0A7X2LUZ7_9BURK|nr:DUF6731 family protein [Pseudoduganella rivuli]MRV73547.1 hypothetical protein [Pseudoduganella rivuli]